jgi:hypothetical protein
MRQPSIIISVGVVLGLLGLFVLPWVRFASASDFTNRREASATWLQQHGITTNLPDTINKRFHLDALEDETTLTSFYDTAAFRPVYEAMRTGRALSAWSMLRSIPFMTNMLRWCIIGLLVALVLNIVFALLHRIRTGVDLVLATYSVITIDALVLIILVSQLHAIDNFGVYSDGELATLLYLSQARPSVGLFLTIIGLIACIVGAGLALGTHSSSATRQARAARYSPRMHR